MSVLQQLKEADIHPEWLTSDSRKVSPGDVFLAYPGEQADGRGHIPQAIERGAAAVLWEQQGGRWDPAWALPNFPVRGLREQAGVIAGEFFGNPSAKLRMTGITGTNGKTSCSHWLAQCLTRLGRKTAVVGTLGNGFPGALGEAVNTTPDPIVLQAELAQYLAQGAEAVAMEVSSHGLDQGRVNGVYFDIAVLTNLSRDHLDYHGSMEAYAAAKSRLFDWPGLRHAVVNADDPFGLDIAHRLRSRGQHVLTYGLLKGDLCCRALNLHESGLELDVEAPQGRVRIKVPVLGRFNAYNVLAVLGALLVQGIALEQAAAALAEIRAVPGRMQQLGGGALPLVVVDYAHTPDALAKVLESLREQCRGNLVCVFGCGGNRDKGKRPLMGEAASRLADRCIVTSDNPRHEDPRAIIDQIITGIGGDAHVEDDRAAAIDTAIRQCGAGDIVLVAGKGHEDYQQIGDHKLPFSDVEVARRVLESMEKTA